MVAAHEELFAVRTALGWIAWRECAGAVQQLAFGHSSQENAIQSLRPSAASATPRQPRARPLAARLKDYAEGAPVEFLDIEVASGSLQTFQTAVIHACRHVAYGETRTYRDLASAAGSPAAARAVGNCMARNRVPLIIPCHRVVAANGGLGGYSAPGGLTVKRRLLEMEAASRALHSPRPLPQRRQLA